MLLPPTFPDVIFLKNTKTVTHSISNIKKTFMVCTYDFAVCMQVWGLVLCFSLQRTCLSLKNILRTDEVPSTVCVSDTLTGVSCDENVLTASCLSIYHLITQGCVITVWIFRKQALITLWSYDLEGRNKKKSSTRSRLKACRPVTPQTTENS